MDLGEDSSKKTEPCLKNQPYSDCPFLLLDVRDRDAYEQCHIIGGEVQNAWPSVVLGLSFSWFQRLFLTRQSPPQRVMADRPHPGRMQCLEEGRESSPLSAVTPWSQRLVFLQEIGKDEAVPRDCKQGLSPHPKNRQGYPGESPTLDEAGPPIFQPRLYTFFPLF